MNLNDINKEIKILEEIVFTQENYIKRLEYKIDDLERMRSEIGRGISPSHLSQSIRAYIDSIIVYQKEIEINNTKIWELNELIKNNEDESL